MATGRIVIFTDDPGWHGCELKANFERYGFNVDYVSLTACHFQINGEDVPIKIPGYQNTLPDAVFVRGVPGGTLEEVVFYLDILHALKLMNVPVYNNAHAIEKSVDKGMTSFLLKRAELPTPVTWEVRDREMALAIAEEELLAGRMLMSKPLFGSQGEGIRRLEKKTDLLWLTSSNGIYYLQRFVPSYGQGFSDIRVFVINGQIIAAMRRHGKFWLNNVARGAGCERIATDDALKHLALSAVSALDMEYAGVDIIQDQQGNYTIIEINSVPAWKGLQSVCDFNIAEALVHDLLSRFGLIANTK